MYGYSLPTGDYIFMELLKPGRGICPNSITWAKPKVILMKRMLIKETHVVLDIIYNGTVIL